MDLEARARDRFRTALEAINASDASKAKVGHRHVILHVILHVIVHASRRDTHLIEPHQVSKLDARVRKMKLKQSAVSATGAAVASDQRIDFTTRWSHKLYK